MAEGAATPGLADERVRALAEEILARPAYREFRNDPTEMQALVARLADWLERTLGWLPDRIESNWEYIKEVLVALLGGLFADGPVPVLLRFVLGAAVLVAIVAMLVALARALRARLGSAEAGTASANGAVRGGPTMIHEAEGLAGEGRFLEAAHCTQLATLELLLRREWISLERSDPNRTLRRRVDAASLPGAERDEFLTLLDRLESHWFRDRVEDRDLYGAWRGLYGRLETMAVAR